MEIAIRKIGNSKGVVLPKPFLAQVGLDGEASANIAVENGAIVLRKPVQSVRTGWSQAAAAVTAKSADELLMGDFGNLDDAGLTW